MSMFFNKTKWVTLGVAVCFAILQALQPFIHAHIDDEHPMQLTGFHVGDEHEEQIALSDHLDSYSLSNLPHASQTVLVETGIKQDINPMLLMDAIACVLLFLCFALILQPTSRLYQALPLLFLEPLKRRLPASRAPPQF